MVDRYRLLLLGITQDQVPLNTSTTAEAPCWFWGYCQLIPFETRSYQASPLTTTPPTLTNETGDSLAGSAFPPQHRCTHAKSPHIPGVIP